MRLPAMAPDSPGNGAGDTYTFQYSSTDDEQPLVAIVESVAWVRGVDSRELEPLHRVINVDTLNDVLGQPRGEFARGTDAPSGLTVTFRYEGCLVTVTQDQITIERE